MYETVRTVVWEDGGAIPSYPIHLPSRTELKQAQIPHGDSNRITTNINCNVEIIVNSTGFS